MFAHLHTTLLGSVTALCFISTTVISEPDDVTVCKGGSPPPLICVLNGSMTSGDVQWYRLLKDTGTTERLGRLEGFTVVPLPGVDSFTTRLYISNAKKSYTGYYWVRSPLGDVCNVSLTVSTGILYDVYSVLQHASIQ